MARERKACAMKKILGLLVAILSVLTISLVVFSQPPKSPKSLDLSTQAKEFINLLVKEDYATAVKQFDETMSKALPPEKLQQTWKTLISQAGAFKRQVNARLERIQSNDVVLVTCEFETVSLDLQIVFNQTSQIAGLFFVPSTPAKGYESPAYVQPESIQEMEVVVGSGEWAVHGTLTLPTGKDLFPAAVLVHGSGPQDRDESLGPNKPFRDLALGLASRKIAVLRYEKRTKEHGLKMAASHYNITVQEESIDDALAAVELLRKNERIDPKRVFVLGHSLGGALLPRIGIRDAGIRGLVVLSAPTRPIEDLILEQMHYIFMLDGSLSDIEKSQLEAIKKKVDKVKDPNLSESTPAAELPFGVSARYWLDLRGYRPSDVAKDMKQPMLILQGERDYQVTMQDFEGWKKSLASRKNVDFKSYPKLNHFYFEGEGKDNPGTYLKAGHVAMEVVEDIANWINKN